jgi:hypothetical protein
MGRLGLVAWVVVRRCRRRSCSRNVRVAVVGGRIGGHLRAVGAACGREDRSDRGSHQVGGNTTRAA